MRLRRLATAGLLMAAAAGCGQAGSIAVPRPVPSTTAITKPLPALWGMHADKTLGFALAFPDAWESTFRDSPSLDTDLKTVESHSPELATYFRQAFAGSTELRLIAADPRSLTNGFATNANVMTSDVGSTVTAPSLNDLVTAKVARLGKDSSVTKPVKTTAAQLSGGTAARLDYAIKTGDTSADVRSYLLLVQRGGETFLFQLTLGGTPEAAKSTFDGLAATFSVFPPGSQPPSPPPASPGGSTEGQQSG